MAAGDNKLCSKSQSPEIGESSRFTLEKRQVVFFILLYLLAKLLKFQFNIVKNDVIANRSGTMSVGVAS